ncbi:hypothetical protein MTO96_014821 [Rhipicephalus appendiculatus]
MAMVAFMCIGTMDIVEAILLGSIPSPSETDDSSSCTELLTVLLLFLKATHACFKCFSAIAVFFTLSTDLLLPTETFLLWNSAAVLLGGPVDVFIYLVRLHEHRLPISEYGCVPNSAKAVLLIIKEVNDYYESILMEPEDQLSPTKSVGDTFSPGSPVDVVPVHLEKKAPAHPKLTPSACAIPTVDPKDRPAGVRPFRSKRAARVCPMNTPEPEHHRAVEPELRHRRKM